MTSSLSSSPRRPAYRSMCEIPDRERCQAVISGMDFDALAERSEYREDLWIPSMSP